ncbi:uncharacterized protein LOC143265138 isoform X2 [Megachile rotundata]|uniref:uncharacterized protein LOC143265138 isoform X2 n=1 Tax=Megachile rotundata TaxID=143995 RepID=UPI003FCF077E
MRSYMTNMSTVCRRNEYIPCFSSNDVGYGKLLVRHYELRFVCRTPQRCRQCIRLQPATCPQERCNTSLPTRQFGNLSAEMRYILVGLRCRYHEKRSRVRQSEREYQAGERGTRIEGGEPKGRKREANPQP